MFQCPARIVVILSLFTFFSASSRPGDEEKSMSSETGYFHHHTVQSFYFGIDTER
jgi:hypothetical protein